MISFNYETKFLVKNKRKVINWIENVIQLEGQKIGEINYIFCDDNYLLKINISSLKEDSLTDIITFDYRVGDIISSDIFISIDRVKENSSIFENSFSDELNRVMIHGILHLIGYDDKNDKDKMKMKEKEDYYLKILSQ